MAFFREALDALLRRKVRPSWFNTKEWYQVHVAWRNRSFFSATVTSAKVLTKMQNMLIDWTQGATEKVINPTTLKLETVYKVNGLAEFRERAADYMIQEGLAKPSDFQDTKITSLVSNARLQLIFNTNTEQAATFATWQTRMSDEDWLNRYPAARFMRTAGARVKRPKHVANEGQVKRWDDYRFWLDMNSEDIGGFQVPWGPYGFNSYMWQQPVKRAEAERLGIVKKGERIKRPDVKRFGVELKDRINDGIEADIDDLSEELKVKARARIVELLGPQAIGKDGNPTLDAYKQALNRIRSQQ
jgi:hypothetical protein